MICFSMRGCFLLRLMSGLCLAFSGAGVVAQTAPAAHSAPPSTMTADNSLADLAADARLDRRCSLHEIGTPLGLLLLKISANDVRLSADRNCDALKLHIRLVNRPLRQLMNSLAELVPGAWYKMPDGKGYLLAMSPAAISRRKRWWDLYLGERQQLFEAMAASALQAMRGRPKLPDEVHSADGNDEGLKKSLLVGPTFFNVLPASLQELIVGSMNETPWYQDRGLMLGTGMDEGATIVPFSDLPPQAQSMLSACGRRPDRPGDETLDNGYVLFENTGGAISADVVDGNGDLLRLGFGMSVLMNKDATDLRLNQNPLVERVKRMGRYAPPTWKVLAAYQESRVWPNGPPPKYPATGTDYAGTLEWLADVGHIEFVADYYSRQQVSVPAPPEHLSRPLKEELNKQAADLDLSWKQTPEQLYLFRNNRWYRDDLLEVPAPLLQRWLDQYAREWAKDWNNRSSLPDEVKAAKIRRMLDWQAEVVTTLTPWQIFGGLKYAAAPPGKKAEYVATSFFRSPFDRQVCVLVYQYHMALFYATLNAAQRTDLLGGRLDFNALAVDQQERAIPVQPLLLIYAARHLQPILLGLRCRNGFAEFEANMHLAITAPSMERAAPNSDQPTASGQ